MAIFNSFLYVYQRVDRMVLPSSLQISSFGLDGFFDVRRPALGLNRVTLPSSLQSLKFGDCFDQSLEGVTCVTLPGGLQSLTFGRNFNEDLQ